MLFHLFCTVRCFSEMTFYFMCVPPSLNLLAHLPLHEALGKNMKVRNPLQHNPYCRCVLWIILFDVLIRTVFWGDRDNWGVVGHHHLLPFCLPGHYKVLCPHGKRASGPHIQWSLSCFIDLKMHLFHTQIILFLLLNCILWLAYYISVVHKTNAYGPICEVPALRYCSLFCPSLSRAPHGLSWNLAVDNRRGAAIWLFPPLWAPVPSENGPPVASALLAPARSRTEPSRAFSLFLGEIYVLLQIWEEFSLSIPL